MERDVALMEAKFAYSIFELSNAAPEQWQAFMTYFEAHTLQVLEDAVHSDASTALIAHGRAQKALQLFKQFRDIRKIIDQKRKA
jgi:hypothetical protein